MCFSVFFYLLFAFFLCLNSFWFISRIVVIVDDIYDFRTLSLEGIAYFLIENFKVFIILLFCLKK